MRIGFILFYFLVFIKDKAMFVPNANFKKVIV